MAQSISLRPPHLTAVALVVILWHATLAADYLNLRFALAEGWPSVMALFPIGPLWVDVAWAMGVWLGLAGALFLMLRDDAAVLLLFAAATAMLAAMGGLATMLSPEALMAMPMAALIPLLVLMPLVGWLYARGLKRRGALR